MALSDGEAQTAYTALLKAAHECDLAWVVEQVEERIAVGKMTTTKIPARIQSKFTVPEPVTFVEEGRERRGAPSVFVASEAYTSTERLALLVDALLLAIPTAHAVAENTLTGIGKFGGVDSIQFAPDVPSSDVREMRLTDLESGKSAISRVERLLNELRAEL